jgi:hypothetical protein
MATTSNIGITKLSTSEKIKTFPTTFNGDMDTIDSAFGSDISSSRSVTQALAGNERGMAIVASGNTHSAISSGQYVYVKKHGSLTEGLYIATQAISANATLSSSNLSYLSSGGFNDLVSNVPSITSNSNGDAYKFPNGIMICSKSVSLSNVACTNAWGSLYESSKKSFGSWPVSFVGTPTAVANVTGGQGCWLEYYIDISSSSAGGAYFVRPTSNTSSVTVHIIAIGRWK